MPNILADPPFLQDNPDEGGWRCNSWKTINGHARQSRKYASCLYRNDRPYYHHVVISIDADLTIEDHRQLWKSIARKLRQRGVTAFYVREFNNRGRLHYHLLTATPLPHSTYTDLETDIIRIHVEHVMDRWAICRYVVKASDHHDDKRRYFHQMNTLDKVGTIQAKGQAFWSKPQRELWSEVTEREKAIASYKPDTYDEAFELHHLVEPSMSFPAVWRTLASQRFNAVEREKRLERRVVTGQLTGEHGKEVVGQLEVVAHGLDGALPSYPVADQRRRASVIPGVPVLLGVLDEQPVDAGVSPDPSVELV